MKKDLSSCTEYKFNGVYIYKITRNDYCVFDESGVKFHAATLKEIKSMIK